MIRSPIRVPGVTCTPLSFDILTVAMISEKDRASLTATMQQFKTGLQAKAQANQSGLAFTVLDSHGRVAVLKWKGIEVAMLFQREISRTSIAPMDKLPTCRMANRDEAWILINLLDFDARELPKSLTTKLEAANARVKSLEGMLSTFQIERDTIVEGLEDKLFKADHWRKCHLLLAKKAVKILAKKAVKTKSPAKKKRRR